MMQQIGRRYSLLQIAHFDNATAHRVMMQELHAMAKQSACGAERKTVL
jgi:hypothetical protein